MNLNYQGEGRNTGARDKRVGAASSVSELWGSIYEADAYVKLALPIPLTPSVSNSEGNCLG